MLISKPAQMLNKLVRIPLCLLLLILKHQVTESLRPPYAAPTLRAVIGVTILHEEFDGMSQR